MSPFLQDVMTADRLTDDLKECQLIDDLTKYQSTLTDTEKVEGRQLTWVILSITTDEKSLDGKEGRHEAGLVPTPQVTGEEEGADHIVRTPSGPHHEITTNSVYHHTLDAVNLPRKLTLRIPVVVARFGCPRQLRPCQSLPRNRRIPTILKKYLITKMM